MDNKKFKYLLITMVALIISAFALFGVQNFVLNDGAPETIQVYVASREVAPYTVLTADMFAPVTVEETTQLPGMVTNLATATDGLHYSSNTIKKGSYLTESVITQDNGEEGLIYTMEVTASFIADVAYNDVVDIYVLSKDNTVTPLFTGKKLYKAKTESLATSADGSTSAYETASKMFIKVTNSEMVAYYTSLKDYKLIVLPFVPEYAGTSTNAAELISEQITYDETQTIEPSTFTYTVVNGDTYDVIASNFGVDVNLLREVNANKDLVAGDTMEIPESN